MPNSLAHLPTLTFSLLVETCCGFGTVCSPNTRLFSPGVIPRSRALLGLTPSTLLFGCVAPQPRRSCRQKTHPPLPDSGLLKFNSPFRIPPLGDLLRPASLDAFHVPPKPFSKVLHFQSFATITKIYTTRLSTPLHSQASAKRARPLTPDPPICARARPPSLLPFSARTNSASTLQHVSYRLPTFMATVSLSSLVRNIPLPGVQVPYPSFRSFPPHPLCLPERAHWPPRVHPFAV